MSEVLLSAKKRETGKKAAKAARNSGMIPGVFYLKGTEPIAIVADKRSMRPIVYTKDARIIKLNIEGQSQALDCILKDVTFDPVSDAITHFDLQGFSADSLVEFEVPVRLVGQPVGVRDGGLLEHILHKVMVRCLPKDLPEHIDVDVSSMRVNQSIHVNELSVSNVAFTTKGEQTVASVVPPRVEAAGAAATGTEPELVGQKGKKEEK